MQLLLCIQHMFGCTFMVLDDRRCISSIYSKAQWHCGFLTPAAADWMKCITVMTLCSMIAAGAAIAVIWHIIV
jgi:hypothetical protein